MCFTCVLHVFYVCRFALYLCIVYTVKKGKAEQWLGGNLETTKSQTRARLKTGMDSYSDGYTAMAIHVLTSMVARTPNSIVGVVNANTI